MEYIWELFINLLGTSLFFIFANGKLDRKEIRYIYAKQTIACIIISIVLWIMNIYNMPTILTILFVLILFHYIYVEIFFSASHIEKFFWVTVFAMTSIFAEALTTIIPTQLFHIDLSEELMGGTLRIPFTLLYMLLIAVFVITLLCFSSRTFKLNFIEKISFIFICFTVNYSQRHSALRKGYLRFLNVLLNSPTHRSCRKKCNSCRWKSKRISSWYNYCNKS